MAEPVQNPQSPVYGRRRSMTPLAWVVVVIGVFGFIAGIIWLGATPAPSSGRTLLENPGAILVSLIGAIAVLGSPIVAKLNAVQREVQNSHKENLRDDLDGKHDVVLANQADVLAAQAEIMTKLDTVIETQREHGGAIVGIRHDLRQQRDVDSQLARDIADVRTIALGGTPRQRGAQQRGKNR